MSGRIYNHPPLGFPNCAGTKDRDLSCKSQACLLPQAGTGKRVAIRTLGHANAKQ